MAGRPAARSWNDIQMIIATASMAATLGLWNLFAGPDRAAALQRAREEAEEKAKAELAATPVPLVGIVPNPTAGGVLLLGGAAPQSQIIVQSGGGGGGGRRGGGGGGGGGGAAASTRSS
jgi:uncharacterized membrane protein YgcG